MLFAKWGFVREMDLSQCLGIWMVVIYKYNGYLSVGERWGCTVVFEGFRSERFLKGNHGGRLDPLPFLNIGDRVLIR